MTAFIIPRTQLSQPTGRIQPSNEWDGYLYDAMMPHLGTSIRGAQIVRSGTPSIIPNAGGLSSIHSGSGANIYRSKFHYPEYNVGDGGVWLCLVGSFDVESFLNDRSLFGFGSDVGGSGNSVYAIGSFDSNRISGIASTDGDFIGGWIHSPTGQSPRKRNAALLVETSLTGFTARSYMFLDGVFCGEQSRTGDNTFRYEYLCAGGLRRGATDLQGGNVSVNMVAAIGGRGNPPGLEAVRDLSRNPWQLFKADPVRIYSFPSGPIIPTITSVGMTNILQNSATANIQLTF